MTVEGAPYRILLYYKFVTVIDHEALAQEHLAYCKKLGIKGRILIAPEGINGTLSGTVEQTDAYMAMMRQVPLFKDMIYKIDESEQHAFKKLFVRPKKELVTFRLEEDVNPNELTGTHLKPKDFYEKLQQEDVIVLDGRNHYEYDIGHFRGAIRPEVETTKEFPEWIRNNLQEYKDKPILTYCTGGIRCEKLSGFLLQEGFKEVYQLDGGIVSYGKDEDVQGRLFDGKCYVFDERISVPINRTDEDIVVGKCYHCGTAEDRYINCANDACHLKHICCEACEEKHNSFCSKECEEKTMSTLEA
ncbi:oxygen-dependent tRNA uridine(34) hydroxylase TrhO [Paenibacillus alginolyticus]|uniref:tRNA uridine(34) hydroxylase n=1 Tax=Paenibacillus alginolyticus TaxID=59839 RepID=A0ABT4G9B2_9BACL|nr:rhodanese-related sulfurtransferase [Paenibacillus alginolyticus]MCY9692773.1 rhodanese-related sulfurtransferase [Paenibacillus alginolyticus]MEC0146094.1 rhodanese-related sulfurtransferase [Paenibacillus alginolyticus]